MARPKYQKRPDGTRSAWALSRRFHLAPDPIPAAPNDDDRLELAWDGHRVLACRAEAEVRNNADGLVYSTEKLLKDQAESFQGSERDDVEGALTTLKEALAGTDTEAIKSATEKLLSASQGFSQRLYEEAAKANSATSAPTAPHAGDDEDIVDAEIVE